MIAFLVRRTLLAGLTSFWQSFGDVRTTDDVIDNLLQAPAAAQAAE